MDMSEILGVVLKMDEKQLKDVKKTVEAIEKIDGEIEALKQQIQGKQDRKKKLIEMLPESIRKYYKIERKAGKRGKYTVTTPDGRITTVKAAYYELYPEREGKSYKYEDMIRALEENGYTVTVEE